MINSYDVIGIGTELLDKLKKQHISNECELSIKVNKENLLKLDEDLYYRQFPEGKDYVPTDGEIVLKFENLTIVVKE